MVLSSRCHIYLGTCQVAIVKIGWPPRLHGANYSSNAKVMINTTGDFAKFVFGKTRVRMGDEVRLATKPVKGESDTVRPSRDTNRDTKRSLGLLKERMLGEGKRVTSPMKKSHSNPVVTLDTDNGIARFFFRQTSVEQTDERSTEAKREVSKNARVRITRPINERQTAKSNEGGNKAPVHSVMTLDTDLGFARFSFGEQKVGLTRCGRSLMNPTRDHRTVVNTDCGITRSSYGQTNPQPACKGTRVRLVNRTGKVAAGAVKKISKKAKINELRWFRLMARKKMRSPNPEVRIRYKLEKAKRKEEWLIERLKKYYVPCVPAPVHDPEILTREEKFYLKRTGEKKKHYVEVGRRGVIGGVVLNMHLHWKRHETVKVICKPCKAGQVHEYAEEISRLSKGIVIDIKNNNTIIFYRGKNYVQPDVMSPTNTLSKPKALEKYKFEQSLEHTGLFIERLEKELEEYLNHIAVFKKCAEESMKKNADKECAVEQAQS